MPADAVTLLHRKLAAWLAGHADKITGANVHVPLPVPTAKITITYRGAQVNREIEDEIMDFDIALANDKELAGLFVEVFSFPEP